MKRLLCVIVLVASLLGCGKNEGLDKGLQLRNSVLQSSGWTFRCIITADYGEKQYEFTEGCQVDSAGNLRFQVLAPESISGIAGNVAGSGGELTFDEQVLAFPLLTDGLLTPVSAPWFFAHSLTSGYINACEDSAEGIKVIIHDSHGQLTVETYIYCNKDNIPYFAEIFWEGRRMITLQISEFTIL